MKEVLKKKGSILTGNIIFILLNLLFLSILILFLIKQGEGAIVLEESYAKQIALLIDSAKTESVIVVFPCVDDKKSTKVVR